MVLAGDINAYSQRRSPRCTERTERAHWGVIIDEHVLPTGNDDQTTHNWTRNKSEGVSILDLIFVY
jgi:hypothetical protein